MSFKNIKISQKKQLILASMGINDIETLLNYFPYRFEDMTPTPLNLESHQKRVVVQATILQYPKVMFFNKQSRMSISLQVDQQPVSTMIFNRHFMRPHLSVGKVIVVIGKYDHYKQSIMASDIKLKPLHELEAIVPVYSIKTGLKQNDLRQYLKEALTMYHQDVLDMIPKRYKEKYHLISKVQALRCIHFPKNGIEVTRAIKTLKYEEFLKFQLVMQTIKNRYIHTPTGVSKAIDQRKLKQFIDQLPFELTQDQQTSLNEILDDLSSNHLMYRLLQGDVGSGKTIVAFLAMYVNYLSGYQSALMVPTEILAKQHHQSLQRFFQNLQINTVLLTGSLKAKEKQAIHQQLKEGTIDMVVGTHALIQQQVAFKKLGLVIADEQHRFGVKQRKELKNKGDKVDFLLMSATPIPRTLAITMFGDMDVSTIKTMPKSRLPIKTHYIKSKSMKSILKPLLEYLKSGGQVYVVCPLIEESEVMDYQNAQSLYESLTTYFSKTPFHVGLLHGKMNEDEKQEVMQAFTQNNIQILVSTTVIEVGVDVGNANWMIVYDAHRFGLSQLHQLRGRVGRSHIQGECFLLSNKKDEEVVERLTYLQEHTDGFDVSTYDLKRRGPGDVLGSKQSGIPTFTIGDVINDFNILEIARTDAINLLEERLPEDGAIFDHIERSLLDQINYMD